MTEDLTTYYAKSRSWADDREASLIRSRRIAWTAAFGAACIAVMEAAALAFALPLKTVVPMAVMVDRTTGYVQQVDLRGGHDLAASDALRRSMLAQYVAARESYDVHTLGDAYRKVALWSRGPARSDYLAQMSASNPAGRIARYGRQVVVQARVKTISMIAPQTALVRFDLAQSGTGGGVTKVEPMAAIVKFDFSSAAMGAEDRFANPLGFQVASYHADPEAAPMPASDGAQP